MADNLYFSRDTRVSMVIGDNAFELPVLDGFSFSQATNATEITLNEFENSSNVSRRGRRMFNDSFAPAEWSFQTYARPFIGSQGADITDGNWDYSSTPQHHAVEEALWAAFVAKDITLTRDAGSDADAIWSSTSSVSNHATNGLVVNFTNSNKSSLTTFDLVFMLGNGGYSTSTHTLYKIEGCVVNEVSIDFDIEGIATISWSGFGKIITEAETDQSDASGEAFHAGTLITEGVSSTNNFIRNRLSALTVNGGNTTGLSTNYKLALTGGSITFSNNITFITPENLGVVNKPLGHVTGTRAIDGSFTCYLSNTTDAGADLFEDLIEISNSASQITNSVALTFEIGGTEAPNLKIALPTCHLEIPTHSIDDIISLETTFHALPSTIEAADEATITYKGIALS
tara:strand:+ start:976 stop:2175 length:1200 start_codon:yes stop_codon:yes gene_type:complete